MPLLLEAIVIGVVISLLGAELFGLSVAGIIVPGYLAFYLNDPFQLFILFCATFLTFWFEKIVSRFTILYGKRLLALDVLSSIGFVYLIQSLIIWSGLPVPVVFDTVGYFIPALVVIYIGSNGIFNTLISLALFTFIVRLLLIVFYFLGIV